MCKSKTEGGPSGGNPAPEVGQFEDPRVFACNATIGTMEGFITERARNLEAGDVWLGDGGASHHIKSSSVGMVNVSKSPPGTTLRQVQGTVNVKEWGTVLLEVDSHEGNRVIKLERTLIVPRITVNLFSLQRVLQLGYLPVYGEVVDKCLIKGKNSAGALVQIATMTMSKGRATLDCVPFNSSRRSSGPAPQLDTFRVELDMQLLHRRLGHSGIDAMRKLMSGKLVNGIDKIKVVDLQTCDFCKLAKLSQGPHPISRRWGRSSTTW